MTNRVLRVACIALPITLAPAAALAAQADYDGRWRLEYACTQNSANGASPFRSRVELPVQDGALSARNTWRNDRLNRDDVEQWSGRFSGSSIAIRTAGSASDGSSWEYEWNGTASTPSEGSVTGGLFASVRGTRTQVRSCEGTLALVAPAPSSLAASVAARPKDAEEAAIRQREAEATAAPKPASTITPAPAPAPAVEMPARPQHAAMPGAAPVPRAGVLASDPEFRREELRWFADRLLDANADNRKLDILLLFSATSGGGVQRNMRGEFVRVGDKPVCVDAREVTHAEPRIPIAQLNPGPKVARGSIGFTDLRRLDQTAAKAVGMKMPTWGPPIVVGKVLPGSPAEKAGLRDGDVVLSIDGTRTHPSNFVAQFNESMPGRVLRLEVWRAFAPGDPAAPPPTAAPAARGSARTTQEPQATGRTLVLDVRLGERMIDIPNAPTHLAALDVYRALRLSPSRPVTSPYESDVHRPANDRAPHEDLAADIAAAARSLVGAALGTTADAVVAGAGGSCWTSDAGNVARSAMLVPRYRVEGGGTDMQDWMVAATLSLEGLRAVRTERLRRVEQERGAREAFEQAMARSAPSGAGALYGALWIVKTRGKPSGWFSPCVIAPSGAHVPGRGMRVEMVVRSRAFREQVVALGIGRHHGSDDLRPTKQFDSLDALFMHVKSTENACNVVLGNGPTLAMLQAALARDGERAHFLPVRIGEADLAELHAQSLGFRAVGQRSAVEAWDFAREIGGLTPAHVEALFILGVDTPEAVGEAVLRHEDEHKLGPMREDAQTLIEFLEDERAAREQRTTIRRLRAEREALALRQATEAQRAHREAEKRRAAEFPFVARIACSIGSTVTAIQSCMSSDGLTTELELSNGGDYRMYKIHDVSQAGILGGQGLEIELRRSFDLRISNASESLVLTVVVTRREDGREVFRRSAARFGALRATN